MVKDETVYSTAWKAVNVKARTIVYSKPFKAPTLFPCIKLWWEYVTVTPDDNNITVFSKGTSNGLIGSIPIGGHWAPNCIVGDKALWKNAQNIAKKNKASETINKRIPVFNPFCTAKVWFPKYVPSLITSRHHRDIDNISRQNPIYSTNFIVILKVCIVSTPLVVKQNKDIQVYNGHGEGLTKW